MLLEKILHQICVVSDERQSSLQWFGRVEKLRLVTGLPDLGERRSSSSCRDCKPERCEEVREKCSYYTTHQCKLDPPHKRYTIIQWLQKFTTHHYFVYSAISVL